MSKPIEPRYDAAELAAGYTPLQHRLNIAGMIAFAAVTVWVGVRALSHPAVDFWLVLGAWGLGMLASDLLTGIVHWACDTWGSPRTPVLGKVFIRSFREHHIDAKAITHHGLVQTNGEQSIVAAPVMALLLAYQPLPDERGHAFTLAFLWFTILLTNAANQFHKWAHQDEPAPFIRALQRVRLILTIPHHRGHHAAPHLTGYCITNGWLNPTLDRIRFWRGLEWLITRVTGVLPRADELGDALAAELSPDAPAPAPAKSEG